MSLTLMQKKALRVAKAKKGKKAVTLPALQALTIGGSHDFGPAMGYADEASANSSRSAIEKVARTAGIVGEAFAWLEPASPAVVADASKHIEASPATRAAHRVTFERTA